MDIIITTSSRLILNSHKILQTVNDYSKGLLVPCDIDQVDGENLVPDHDTAAAVDGRLQRDPRDEHSVHPVQAVALADVEAQGLAGSFHDLNEGGERVGVLKYKQL